MKQHLFKWVLLFSAYSASTFAQMDGMPPAQVEVVIIQAQSLAPTMQLKGNVIALQDAVLSSEVEGLLESVLLVGERVKKGQVLAKINAEKLQWQLQREQAELAGLQADLKFREQEVERFQTLANRDNAAKNQLQQEITLRENLKQQIISSQADVAEAQRVLNDTQIKAPFDGVIAARLGHIGEYIRIGDPLLRLVNEVNKDISVPVPIRYQDLLTAGMTVDVEYHQRPSTAPIRRIVRIGDPNSRMVEVRLNVSETPLIVGDSVTVFVPTSEPGIALAVPRDAIVIRGSRSFVYVVDENDKAKQISATIKYAQGPWVVLEDGIKEGDKVIIRGAERLQPNSPVLVGQSG